ncbi:MAG: TfoX/Sxy family protein [Clostridia bacterium]|nr:TfoX/Sxy family protein [Clostridia bacterium]
MATSKEYIDFVLENIHGFENVKAKKMFGEYMIYINEKPVLLICDNTVFVKKIPEVSSLFENAECGFPYDGAKEHFILDVENEELLKETLCILEKVTPLPKKRKKKGE